MEESGIKIKNVRFQYLANIKKYSGKHYVHISLLADWASGKPQVLEPEKSEEWGWYEINQLPAPVFEPCRLSVESLKNNDVYYDS